jgi:hypothetical protein
MKSIFVKTNCFDSRNNESEINVRTSQLLKGGETKETLFAFSVSNDLPNNLPKYSTRALSCILQHYAWQLVERLK